MRNPKTLYVVFVRLKTGSTVVHAATGDHQHARYMFRMAEERTDIDQIMIVPYTSWKRTTKKRDTPSGRPAP